MMIGYVSFRSVVFRNPTLTPSVTLRSSWTSTSIPTETLTPTPSWTPRQTSTQTPAPTLPFTGTPPATDFPLRAMLPSLTPAAALVFDGAYQLVGWDAARADQMALTLQGFPLGLSPDLDPGRKTAYFQSYQYPAFAYREALLRFSDAPETENWRWALAHNLMLMGSAESGEVYAGLIADGLNRDQTSIEELYAWFPIQEPALTLFMAQGSVPPGFLDSFIVELRGQGGSAFIWLLHKSAGYEAYPIWTDFDFVHPRQSNWILADLDNAASNGMEIAIYQSTLASETVLQPLRVFNLGKVPPVQLNFLPDKGIFEVGSEFRNYWALRTDQNGKNELVFQTTVFPACPLQIQISYRWNGLYFKQSGRQIKFDKPPDDLSECEPIIDLADRFWGVETTAALMEELLPFWPPEKNTDGEPYPLDAIDEWKYRLGVYHALAGDFDLAVGFFNDVSTHPATPTSRWIEPSQKFLAAYQKPEDIYIACWLAPYCDPSHAIRFLTKRIPGNADALEYLRKWGVQIVSSGYFDFDDDDESERWFTVRNSPNQKLDFWILARSKGYHQALWVGIVESRLPTITYIEEPYIADDGLEYHPAVLLDGKYAISMQRFPDTYEPYLVQVPLREEYPSRFFIPLASYREALFSGASPELIQKELENLADFPGLLCKNTWSCDEYYYLLGLASELAGDEQTAVKSFQRLWLDYTKSPFTQMARMKLTPIAGVELPTPIGTATPTMLPTIHPPTETLAPGITPTLTGTAPTVTPTGSLTIVPTVTGTPPTSTPSPSATGSQGTASPYPQPTDYPTVTPYP